MKYLLFSILPFKKINTHTHTHTHTYIYIYLPHAYPSSQHPLRSLDFHPHQAVTRSSSLWQCHLRPLRSLDFQPLLPPPPPWHSNRGPLSLPTAAAAAAKSLQSCPTLCNPVDGSPPGSPVPGILQARTLEWGAISFSNTWKWKVKMKSLSRVRLLATPRTAAHQFPPSIGFSRQEYWSGSPLPPPLSRLSIQ